jgi:hypothetical protein
MCVLDASQGGHNPQLELVLEPRSIVEKFRPLDKISYLAVNVTKVLPKSRHVCNACHEFFHMDKVARILVLVPTIFYEI